MRIIAGLICPFFCFTIVRLSWIVWAGLRLTPGGNISSCVHQLEAFMISMLQSAWWAVAISWNDIHFFVCFSQGNRMKSEETLDKRDWKVCFTTECTVIRCHHTFLATTWWILIVTVCKPFLLFVWGSRLCPGLPLLAFCFLRFRV